MSTDHIRYDVLAQEALRGVVRKVLSEVAKAGLPGEHHFYIAFDTGAAGVRISSKLRERYPSEMTIVLQHQFWDLNVTDHAFEVGLSFDGTPERLLVPFTALKGFFDPTVQFGLQFDPRESSVGDVASTAAFGTPDDSSEPIMPAAKAPAPVPTPVADNSSTPDAPEVREPAPEDEAGEEEKPAGDAVVVSLDSFRKK